MTTISLEKTEQSIIKLLPIIKTVPLSQKDLIRLMSAQIVSGMLSGDKYKKIEIERVTQIAIDCATKIIEQT